MSDVALEEAARIDQAIQRAPTPTDKTIDHHLGGEAGDIVDPDDGARHAMGVLDSHIFPEAFEVALLVETEEVTALAQPHFLVHLLGKGRHHRERELGELDVDGGRELMAHPAGIQAGGALPEQLVRLEDDDIGAPALGEVVGGGGAHDAASDDDRVGCGLHGGGRWMVGGRGGSGSGGGSRGSWGLDVHITLAMKVLVSTSWPVRAWQIPTEQVTWLREQFPGIDFVHVTPGDDVLGPIADAEICLASSLKPEVIDQAPRLRWVHSTAAAVDDLLPLKRLAEHHVVVTNSRGVQAVPIAEHVMAGLLILARRYDLMIAAQRERRWIQAELGETHRPWMLLGRRMTIVGLGAIGEEIACRAHAFGMRVTGVRRRPDRPASSSVERVFGADQLSAALGGCEALVIAAPFVASTKGMIGANEIALLAPGAILVNIGRAQIVDSAAMLEALHSGQLGGAVLDVFDREPLDPASPLWELPNVLVSPHSSGFRSTHWEDTTAMFADNLRRYLRGEPLINVVDRSAGY